MSQGTALYEFLYDWANQVLNAEFGLSMSIVQSHQDIPSPSDKSPYLVIDYAPNRTKIGSFSAGDTGDLAAEHQYEPTFETTDVDITNDIITITGHSFVENDLVSFSTTDTLPGGLAIDTYYHIITVTTDTFQVSATRGGAAINLTSVGVGTHTVSIEGKRTLINDYDFIVELWEVNGTGETLRLLLDSMDGQDIRDLWSASKFALKSQGIIQNMPRLPQSEWVKESMVEITIGTAEATLETPGFFEDVGVTGAIGDHTVTI